MLAFELTEALPQDAEVLLELFTQASRRYLSLAYGKACRKMFLDMLRRPDNLISYNKAIIMMNNGDPAGMVLGYSAEDQKKEGMRTGQFMQKHLGFRLIRAAFVSRIMPRFFNRIQDGEYLIASLAVFPEYQRNGGARLLLKAMENKALMSHSAAICLDVKGSNTGAINLYKSLGYEIILESKPKYFKPNIGFVFRMSKSL